MLIVNYSCLYYIVEIYLVAKDFFLCIKTTTVKFISKIYGGQYPEWYDYIWLSNKFWKFSEKQIFPLCFW